VARGAGNLTIALVAERSSAARADWRLVRRHRHRRLRSRRDGRSPGMRSPRLARFGGAAPM